MCLGQLGSLLPHVVVPSILAAFLIPEWHLSGAQAGLLAGIASSENATLTTIGVKIEASEFLSETKLQNATIQVLMP